MIYYVYDETTKQFLYPVNADKAPANATPTKPVDEQGKALFEPIVWNGQKWTGATLEEWQSKLTPIKPQITPQQMMQAQTLKQLVLLKVSLDKIQQQQEATAKITAKLMLDQAKEKLQGVNK